MDKNQFRDYFQDENNELPEYLSWDKMEEGILSKMESLEPPINSTKPSSLIKRWFFLFIFASTLGVLYYMLIPTELNNSNAAHTNAAIITSEPITKDNLNVASTTNAEQKTAGPQNTIDSYNLMRKSSLATSINNTNTSFTQNHAEQEHSSIINENIFANKQSRFTTTNNSILKPEYQNLSNITTPFIENVKVEENKQNKGNNTSTTIINTNLTSEGVQQQKSTVNLFTESKNELTLLKRSSKLLNLPIRDEAIPITYQEADEIKPVKTNSNWSVGIYSGVTYWSSQYKNTVFGNAKKDSETGLTGFGTEGIINYRINEKWSVSTGLAYHTYNNRFNYYSERDTNVIIDVVTERRTNIISGQITEVTEMIESPAVNWRRVVHYNQYKQIAIPLVFARNWKFKNQFTASTGIGMNYTFSSNESGKALYAINQEQNIFAPQIIQASDYNFRNSLSLLINLDVHYQLTQCIEIGLATQFNRFLSDIDNSPAANSNPIGLSSKIGLRYNF